MNAKRVLQCALVAVMPFGLLSTYVLAGDNAAAIKEFGIAKGEPIDKGFFFWNYEYVEAPYVVERRGLDIYINDHLVSPGPEWPPYDETVDEDPGEPPPGSSPFDATPPGVDYRDTYWVRKWRYLHQHHDFETAKRKLIGLYRECGAFRNVTPDKEFPHRVVVVEKSGETTGIKLMPTPKAAYPDKQSLLAARKKKQLYYEIRVRSNGLMSVREKGGETIVGGALALRAIGILLSEVSDQEKIEDLEKMYVLSRWRKKDRQLVTKFKPTLALIERFNRMKGKLDKAGRRKTPTKDAAPPAPRPETLSPEEEQARAEQAARDMRLLKRWMERERWKRVTETRDWSGPVARKDVGVTDTAVVTEIVSQRTSPPVPAGSSTDRKSKIVWLVIGLWSLVGVTTVAFLATRAGRSSRRASDRRGRRMPR